MIQRSGAGDPFAGATSKQCRIAPESFDPDQPVRVFNYGRSTHVYRVFFTIDATAKVVRVVHVRRGARQRPAPGELKGE